MPAREKGVVIVRIQGNVLWEVARALSTGRFVGLCRELNLNAVGDTWAKFRECANDAIQMLLVALFKEGELKKLLLAKGWHALSPVPKRGSAIPKFDVPFSLQRKQRFEELVRA